MLHNKIIQRMRHVSAGLFVHSQSREKVRLVLTPPLGPALLDKLSHGHILLGAERAVFEILELYQAEFPFSFSIVRSEVDSYLPLGRVMDLYFSMTEAEWEELRFKLSSQSRFQGEFVVQAHLRSQRLAAKVTLTVAFELEKFLPA